MLSDRNVALHWPTQCHQPNLKFLANFLLIMIDVTDEKLTLSILDDDVSRVVDEPTITSPESLIEANAAGSLNDVNAVGFLSEGIAAGPLSEGNTTESLNEVNAAGNFANEMIEVTIPDDSGGVSLLGSSSQSGAVRNYEIYNRMDGCSSDEETQTDNDDSNSIEDGAEILPEHRYVVLHDEMFEFGEFTSADISNDVSSNGSAESKESLNGVPIVPHIREYKNNDQLGANSVEVIDPVSSESGSAAAAVFPPPVVEEPYVSIPPLSAGNNVRNA
jgi:hypothetical protein